MCFINRIDARKNCFEVCDFKHSVRCEFLESTEGYNKLVEAIEKQSKNLNILGLLGKQLQLRELAVCLRGRKVRL